MKKILYLSILLAFCFTATAQFSFESTNKYGKLWDIKYDAHVPNKLYALTLVNHLMVSVDNGVTWKIMYSYPDEKSSLAVLKIAPGGNALTFVVKNSAELRNNGVYVMDIETTDIIRHYLPPNWTDNPSIPSYSMFGENGTSFLMHTSYQVDFSPFTKVFYSSSSGDTWNEVYFSSDNDYVHINNVAISPVDSNKLYLARGLGSEGSNGGLFISDDAGASFSGKLGGIAVDPIAFDPANPNRFFVGTGISFGATPENIYETTNGGNTFTIANITWNDQTLNNVTVIAFDPTNAGTIYALDENEYLKSTDNGVSWTNTPFTPDNVTYYYGTSISIDPFNSDHLFMNSDGWPQYSADGGATLTQAKNPFCNTTTVSFGGYRGDKHLYYATLSGYLDKNLQTNVDTDYLVSSPFLVNGRIRFPIADTAVQGRVFVYTPGDGFFNTSQLKLSDDYGATGPDVPADDFSNRLEAFKKDPNSTGIYYASYSSFGTGNLYKLDATDPLNPVNTMLTMPTDGAVTSIVIAQGNPNTIYVSENSSVYKSIDGGFTWSEKIVGLDLSPGNDFILDLQSNPLADNQLAVTTTRGIYLSGDSAENWSLSLQEFIGHKISFSPITSGRLISSSRTSSETTTQLAYTIDGGVHWTIVTPDSLQHLQTAAADFNFLPTGIDVYFATSDMGVVKYQVTNLPDPLPLRLLSFTGVKRNNAANLIWKTSHEDNVNRYELERSIDGRQFSHIYSATAFNSSGDHSYTYNDMDFALLSARYGPVFYRIKMIDTDGRFTYSATVQLRADGANNVAVIVYPNPVSNQLNLQLTSSVPKKYTLKIIDAAGKEYLRRIYAITQGTTAISIPVDHFAKGVYALLLEDNNGTITTTRFVKN